MLNVFSRSQLIAILKEAISYFEVCPNISPVLAVGATFYGEVSGFSNVRLYLPYLDERILANGDPEEVPAGHLLHMREHFAAVNKCLAFLYDLEIGYTSKGNNRLVAILATLEQSAHILPAERNLQRLRNFLQS